MNNEEPILKDVAGSIRAQRIMAVLANRYPNIRFTQVIQRWVNDHPYAHIYAEGKHEGRGSTKPR